MEKAEFEVGRSLLAGSVGKRSGQRVGENVGMSDPVTVYGVQAGICGKKGQEGIRDSEKVTGSMDCTSWHGHRVVGDASLEGVSGTLRRW